MKSLFIFVLTLTVESVIAHEGELLATVIIFRDGERTPIKAVAGDPLRAYWESIGYGQLTTYGKKRMYQLGKWLRQRYDRYIPTRYKKETIFVRSIDYDEAITSAYMVLAGLYPSLKNQIFDENLKWQPIPVHTESLSRDYLLQGKSACEKHEENGHISLKNRDGVDISNRKWFDPKLNLTTNSDDIEASDVMDSILAARSEEEKPESAALIDSKKVEGIKEKALTKFEVPKSTSNNLTSLQLGPLFYEITRYFNRFLPGAPKVSHKPKFKALIYAGVMETLQNVIQDLKQANILHIRDHIPNFGATLLFELRDGGYSKPVLNIFYKNSTTTLKQYKIIDCGTNCAYKVFLKRIEPLITEYEEAKAECERIRKKGTN